MLAVIVVHITGGALEASPVGTPDFMVLNVYDGLTHWCVPVFVMLSGMFLLDPKHSLPPSKLFFGHMLRIAAALAVWGTAYALVERVQVHGLSWESVRAALYQVLLGKTCFHLWFLYMLLGLYLVTPVLRAFVRGAGRGDFHWFFLLVFVFTFLLPTLLRLRPSQTVSLYQSYLNIKLVLGYVGYYVLGYYLKEYTLSRPAEYLIYLLGIAGAAVTVGGTAWLSQQRGALAQTFYNYDSPNIALMSTAVFVLFRYLLGVSDERSRRQRFSGVAKWSREAPPCHITMVGSHHPLREPDLHLSMYPALLSFGQQLLTGCGLQHGIFCTQPAFYAVLQSLQSPMPACP